MNRALLTSTTPEWATPADFFQELDKEFRFDLDPCATKENAKCADYFTKEQDGLAQNWGGAESVLQPAVRARAPQVGAQVLRGKQEGGAGRYADTSKDGHRLLPRLYLPQGEGGALHTRAAALQWPRERGTLPVYGRNILRQGRAPRVTLSGAQGIRRMLFAPLI